MKKYSAAALAAACCAAGSSAAVAAVFASGPDNGAVVASRQQRQDRIVAPENYQFGHHPEGLVYNAVGLGDPNSTTPGAIMGATSAPVFGLGTGHAIDRGADSPPAVAAIRLPEPATWAMMFLGLSMIGLATRRRRNVDVPSD